MNDDQKRMLAIVREFYGRVVWSHKTYEKERELSSAITKRDKKINVILMATTTTGVLASIPLGTPLTTIVAAFISFVSTGFAIYQLSFVPETDELRQTAKNLLIERERLVILIEKTMSNNANLDDIREEFQEIIERVMNIYANSPDTSTKAYILATKGLKFNEELTFAPEEIDMLLPKEIRLNKQP